MSVYWIKVFWMAALWLIGGSLQKAQGDWLSPYGYPFFHLPPYKKACAANERRSLPILLFPGCNDWCPGIDYFELAIRQHTNSDVHCIDYSPKIDSVFNNMEKMVDKACRMLEAHKDALAGGYILIGLSMGGLVARGILQMCSLGQYATKLITLGAPHMGVSAVPSFEKSFMIEVFNKIFKSFAYSKVIQRFVGSTNFFKIPDKYPEFLRTNTFLSVMNNEGLYVDQFRQRIIRLKDFVLVHYKGENFLQPKETVVFGWHDPKNPERVVALQETKLYKQDLIGLKHLNERGRLHFVEVPGRHQNPAIVFAEEFKKIVYYCF